MRLRHLDALKNKNLISDEEYNRLEPIYSRRIVSVFYELRIILYLGVMLFTTGIGILIYENIGEFGHMLSIAVLFILTAWCFHYSLNQAPPYQHGKTTAPSPFFDYIVLLGCLLFISALGYVQFQYEFFNDGMGLLTLITAAFFFFAAYRFDHLGVLALAITALASFFSISASPQKWYSTNFLSGSNHHHTALVFAIIVGGASLFLDKKEIKKHFTFTYLNFCALIFLTAAVSGMFIDDDIYLIYLILLLSACAVCVWYGQKSRSFLFLLYAFVFGYIGVTYVFIDLFDSVPELWFFYFFGSCGAFIWFIIRYKSFFKRSA